MNLRKDLGMITTAEGVETQDQMDWLEAHGCTEIQGYLISRPVPAKDIPPLLADRKPPRGLNTLLKRSSIHRISRARTLSLAHCARDVYPSHYDLRTSIF